MNQNIVCNPRMALVGLALVGAISTAPRLAEAQTPVSCQTVLSAIQNGVRATGTVVGKSQSNYSMVQVATARNFNPNTWNPASTGASSFSILRYSTYLRGQFKTVQTFSSSAGNPGWSGEEDLWIYRSGVIYSRSLTWNSRWSRWQNVRCYRATSPGVHYGTSNPLQRLIIQGWNPYNGAFITLDLAENHDLI